MKMREKMRRFLRYEEKEILTDQDYSRLELFVKMLSIVFRKFVVELDYQYDELKPADP